MICWTRRLLAQMKNNKKLMIYTSYKTDATNISVTGLQQFGSVSGFLCVRMSGDYRVRADFPIIGRDPWEMFDKFISIGMLKAEEYG